MNKDIHTLLNKNVKNKRKIGFKKYFKELFDKLRWKYIEEQNYDLACYWRDQYKDGWSD